MRCVVVLITVGLFVAAPFGWAHETGDADAHKAEPGERSFQVLKAFPLDPDAYQGHAADLAERGIPEKYGHEEWAAVVMAHEFHQHIGIMTVVGAKMAVRARELLEAPSRAVKVVTETGPNPPYSCAVDGVQAAIGSTYAQELISAPPVEEPALAATFEYGGRKVRLALKEKYRDRISQCIQAAIKEHGNLTPEYFGEIEHFSYHVWAEFDRREIFEEEGDAPR